MRRAAARKQVYAVVQSSDTLATALLHPYGEEAGCDRRGSLLLAVRGGTDSPGRSTLRLVRQERHASGQGLLTLGLSRPQNSRRRGAERRREVGPRRGLPFACGHVRAFALPLPCCRRLCETRAILETCPAFVRVRELAATASICLLLARTAGPAPGPALVRRGCWARPREPDRATQSTSDEHCLPRRTRLAVRVNVGVASAQFILFGRCGVGVGGRRVVFLAATASVSAKEWARVGHVLPWWLSPSR